MADPFFLKSQGISLPGLRRAAKHNGREIAAEMGSDSHIDSTQSHRNVRLEGPATAREVIDCWQALMTEAGARLNRKDAVACIETVFSLPVGTMIDLVAYFTDCTDWARQQFGCPVLVSDVHMDEDCPHCHVLQIALKDGRLQGSALLGDKVALRSRTADFEREVARRYGLSWGRARLRGRAKREGAEAAIRALRLRDDPALRSTVWSQLRRLIGDAPEPVMEALGIDLSTPTAGKSRSFADIMTSPGKGASWEPEFLPDFTAQTPIGVQVAPCRAD